jgi:hypothetical protein
MVLCNAKAWFSHDQLPQGEVCPYCPSTAPAPTPTPSLVVPPAPATVTSIVSAPAAIPTATATSTIIPTAQYSTNPIIAVKKSRAIAIARTRAPPPLPAKILLALKVVHAITDNDSDPPSFRHFIEGWNCGIIPTKTFSTRSLTAYLLADARVVPIPTSNWNEAVFPLGEGQWRLATNEVFRTKPNPQIIRAWPGEMTIQEIIDLQEYRLEKKATAYPMTLIWYTTRAALDGIEQTPPSLSTSPPPAHISISSDESDLPSLSSLLGVPNHLRHKRSISDALPNRLDKAYPVKKEEYPIKKEGDDETKRINDNTKVARGVNGNTQEARDDEAERGCAQEGQRRSGRKRTATAKVNGAK